MKNIIVIDKNGNTVGSTYKRRADGLVKKGRAQFIGDTAIMLCTSKNDNKNEVEVMANSIYDVFDNQVSKMQEHLNNSGSEEQTAEVRIQILKSMEEFRKLEHKDKVVELVREQLTAMQSALVTDKESDSGERDKVRLAMIALMDKLVSCNADNNADDNTEAKESTI